MDMKDRIQAIMSYEKMTPSRFAEEIGVQRSAMSHILSGRNNPSLDLYSKIVDSFPHINSEWLLNGKGDMLKMATGAGALPINQQPDLFTASPSIKNDEKVVPLNQNMQKAIPETSKTPENRQESSVRKSENRKESFEKEEVIATSTEVKSISRIIIFYSDNTYEIINPDRKR